MPGFIKPQLATLKTKAPKGEQCLHEIKYDGYRVQVHVNSGKKRVFTCNGLDWTKRFSVIAGALDFSGQAIIDGEAVVIHEGRTNFSELRQSWPRASRTRWSIMPLTCCVTTATCAVSPRLHASKRCQTCWARTTSAYQLFTSKWFGTSFSKPIASEPARAAFLSSRC